MANCYYKGKEVRSRSDRDREVKLSWAHTVTQKHTDINFRVTDSVANIRQGDELQHRHSKPRAVFNCKLRNNYEKTHTSGTNLKS